MFLHLLKKGKKMIEKKTHEKLTKKWEKIHAPYQRWNRITTRMPIFLKYIDCFKGKEVVEFGCNAGIYGYEIAKVAKSYIGVDQGSEYIQQAKITKKVLNMENATFLKRKVKGFIRDLEKAEECGMPTYHINAIFASFVLYHLKDKETDLIKRYLLPKCDTVLILTRTSKRSPWKKYNSLKLHKIKNVEKYLERAGFKCKSEMHSTGKFGITLATKDTHGNDKGSSKGSEASTNKRPGRSSTQGKSEKRVRKGNTVLPAQRETNVQGTDGILSQVQKGVGSKSVLQDRQRKVLPPKPKSRKERMEEPKKVGRQRRNTKITKDSKGKT